MRAHGNNSGPVNFILRSFSREYFFPLRLDRLELFLGSIETLKFFIMWSPLLAIEHDFLDSKMPNKYRKK